MLKWFARVSGCIALAVGFAGSASGQQIWSGYDFSFTKTHGADWTIEANQDRITTDTWITRQNDMGLFNIRTEAFFTSFVSPLNTEWAYDLPLIVDNDGRLIAATNFANLTFTDWRTAIGSVPPNVVGLPAVLHLIQEDIYIDFRLTVWLGALGGGFTYARAVPEPSSMLLNSSALVLLAGLYRVRGLGYRTARHRRSDSRGA